MSASFLLPTPQDSMLALLKRVIRIPSQTAIDEYGPIIGMLEDWFSEHGLEAEILQDHHHEPISMAVTLGDLSASEHYLLVAPLDTAPIGQRGAWAVPPTAAMVRQGWLYGRGSADCGAAIAIFAHLMAALREEGLPKGDQALHLILDGEEHSGTLAGFKRVMSHYLVNQKIAGAYIGYPGIDEIVAGARGYWRATVRWLGEAAHSGSTSARGRNALLPASQLAQKLYHAKLPASRREDVFPLSPQQTVTGLRGGTSFSVIPEQAELDVDVRLTPGFTDQKARQFLESEIEMLRSEQSWAEDYGVEIEEHETQPAYQLDPTVEIVDALQGAARRVLSSPPEIAVAGPSNVGNYLAQMDIPATCGFGVDYKHLHAPNECIRVNTLGPVYQTYGQALLQLFNNDRT